VTSTSTTSRTAPLRIGCAAGFWGDTETAARQLLEGGNLDYLVFDYLAEITMSIMAGARLRDPARGYATDFVSRVLRDCLKLAVEKRVRIVTNAGGVNPLACRAALLALAEQVGVSPRVAVVLGDDITALHGELAGEGVREMFTGAPLPAAVLSANAYFGAKPIAAALAAGADIVITGRIVDSALALGPLVHEFGWRWDDFDRLAQGSLAGHIIECGAQCTGGLFTDWESVPGYDDMGYPIVACEADGSFTVEKPAGTGGLITPAVVYEQLVYEIGDPRNYILPDVICDFSRVTAEQVATDRVRVTGATGRAPTDRYKVSATYPDGFRVALGVLIGGEQAVRKGERVARALIDKVERLLEARGLGRFRATQIDALGAESSYGPHARARDTREVVIRIAASHSDRDALKLLVREVPQAGTSMAPGFATLVGGQPDPATMIKLFSFLIEKARVPARVELDGRAHEVEIPAFEPETAPASAELPEASRPPATPSAFRLALIRLAHGRSGDKGDHSNIGVIAREPRFAPLIAAALTAEAVAEHMAHVLDPVRGRVTRYGLPGCHGWNFLLEHALGGGGVASLRADPQGKAFAQQLLAFEVPVPEPLFRELEAAGPPP
jgi:hypothetical protein